MKRLLLAAVLAAMPLGARAATNCSATIGTTPVQILGAAGPVGTTVSLQNVGTTTIGISWFTPSPAIGAAGTYTLAPGASLNAAQGVGSPGAIAYYAVSSAAGGALTCSVN